MMLDRQGRLVWFSPVERPPAFNLDMQSYGGKPALTWWQGDGDQRARLRAWGRSAMTRITRSRRSTPVTACRPTCTTSSSPPAGRRSSPPMRPTTADLSSIGESSQGQVFVGHAQEIDLKTGRGPVRLEQPRPRRHRGELPARPAPGPGRTTTSISTRSPRWTTAICSSARATRATLYKVDRSTREDPVAAERQALGLQPEPRGPLLVAARCPSARVVGDHRVRQRGAGQGEAVARADPVGRRRGQARRADAGVRAPGGLHRRHPRERAAAARRRGVRRLGRRSRTSRTTPPTGP